MVSMAQPTSHPKTPYTWNWATDLLRLHTQLQRTLKGAFMLVFSINYSKCHHGQLAAVNWIWQVNLRVLSTECTGELGWAKVLTKTENRRLKWKKIVRVSIKELGNIYPQRKEWPENIPMRCHLIILKFFRLSNFLLFLRSLYQDFIVLETGKLF